MTKSEALRELESMGTEQNRKLYQRHGVKGPAFGVSYANLGALQRRIRIDHPLALALWATGNHDARVLANMIAEPNSMSARAVDRISPGMDLRHRMAGLRGARQRGS